MRVLQRLLIAALVSLTGVSAAVAQGPSVEDLVSAVVRIKTFINPDGTSVSNLGRASPVSAALGIAASSRPRRCGVSYPARSC